MSDFAASISSTAPHAGPRVYTVAQDLAVGAYRLTDTLPRGYADLRDQMRRASHAVVRNIAEGAGRDGLEGRGRGIGRGGAPPPLAGSAEALPNSPRGSAARWLEVVAPDTCVPRRGT